MQKKIFSLVDKPVVKYLRFGIVFVFAVVYYFDAFAEKGNTTNKLDKKISVDFKNIPLKEAVAKLGQCLPGVSLTYVETGLLNKVRVNFSATDEKASEVLDKILAPLSFNYTVLEYHVVIWFDAARAVKPTGGASVSRHAKIARIKCIKGIVTNLSMDALPNVTIMDSGGVKVGGSDSLGGFTLRDIPADAIFVFSAKGYKALEVHAKTAAEGFLLVQLAKYGNGVQVPPLHK